VAEEPGKPRRKPRSKSTYGGESREPPYTGYGDGNPDDEGEAVEAHAEFVARHFGGGVEATPAGRGRPRSRPDPAEPARRGERRRRGRRRRLMTVTGTVWRPVDRARSTRDVRTTAPSPASSCTLRTPTSSIGARTAAVFGRPSTAARRGARCSITRKAAASVRQAAWRSTRTTSMSCTSGQRPRVPAVVQRPVHQYDRPPRALPLARRRGELGAARLGLPGGKHRQCHELRNVSITEVIVDPADSNRLYVAADDGVNVSTDRGLNWIPGARLSAAVDSLELDTTTPANARVLYAGVNGSGVFRSTDSGANWTSVLSLPAGAQKVIARLAPPTSPPAANGIQVIYCCAGGSGATDPLGFWVSTNAGAATPIWTQQTATNIPVETYSSYCLAMAVDPSSPGDGANDVVYVGTRDQGVTTNSGVSFTAIGGLHADSHAWAFAPGAPGDPPIVLCGTDDWPAIAVTLEEQLEFGTVCPAGDHLTIEVSNVGKGPLRVDSIAVLFGASSFAVETSRRLRLPSNSARSSSSHHLPADSAERQRGGGHPHLE
jgi:hypothetical protein